MGINIAGAPLSNMVNNVRDSQTEHDLNRKLRMESTDVLLNNIQAIHTTGRTYVGSFPNFQQTELDICS